MKALILNSGMGTRMGDITSEQPKCMTEIAADETIVGRQLQQLRNVGKIEGVIMTTGAFDGALERYCHELELDIPITFVKNPIYKETNYIYSIYCARDYLRDQDIILLHGDLVFEDSVLDEMLELKHSAMTISSTLPLPEKDFKAVLRETRIEKIGIEFFDNAYAAQPLYKLDRADWMVWLENICKFCEQGQRKCYAENAFNQVSDRCHIYPMDVRDRLCNEIDDENDLAAIQERMHEL